MKKKEYYIKGFYLFLKRYNVLNEYVIAFNGYNERIGNSRRFKTFFKNHLESNFLFDAFDWISYNYLIQKTKSITWGQLHWLWLREAKKINSKIIKKKKS